MAKNSYKVTFSSNFSFKKLSSKIGEVLGEKNEAIIDSLAQITKRNITDGNLRELSPATLEARRGGDSSFKGHNPSPTTETRPLLYSGALLKSIKPTEDGIEMLEYGLAHNEGFTTPRAEIGFGSNKSVPARQFIAGEKELKRDKKQLEKVQDDLVVKMQMIMKK